MRPAGVDYAYLFRRFPLVKLRDDAELEEALAMDLWLDGRTLSDAALDYRHVLRLVIADYIAAAAPADLEGAEEPEEEVDEPTPAPKGRKK